MKTMMFIRPPFNGMDKYIPPHLGIATLYSYLNSHLYGGNTKNGSERR